MSAPAPNTPVHAAGPARGEPTAPARLDPALVRRGLVGLVVLLGVAGMTGWLLRDPVVEAGRWFVDALGPAGLFTAVTLVDASPVPMTNEPLVLLALGGGLGPWTIFAIVSGASVLAGFVGHVSGALVDRRLPIGDYVERKQPEAARWIRTRGAWGVAVAAVLPMPYALATWTAGAMGVPLRHVMLASLLRVPKTAFYVWLLTTGWRLGG